MLERVTTRTAAARKVKDFGLLALLVAAGCSNPFDVRNG